MLNKIKYFIDDVSIEENELTILGWVYASNEKKVQIEVQNTELIFLEELDRIDIYEKFKEEAALDSGFKITVKNIERVILIFKIDGETIKCKVNAKKIMGRGKSSKIKTIMKIINPYNFIKLFNQLRFYGFNETFFRIKRKLRMSNLTSGISYNDWYRKHEPRERELKIQKNFKFDYAPKISIIVPTFNTKEEFLIDMIESVKKQSYTNWELCIADGASISEATINILKNYEKRNDRIKVKFLDKNYMISGNSNEALKMVSGDYIALLDHDDILTPNALYEIVKAINKNNDADFIYSDEDKTDESKTEYFDPHFKPNWSPDTFTSYNYICHFTAFSKKLMDEVGMFNPEFDGSQDYDLFLRLTEKANRIIHIPKILYHWRVHKESTAGGIGAKTYCMDAAKHALNTHLERIGIEGEAVDGLFLGSYKIQYKIQGNPKVSIIIPNKDEVDILRKCINSIIEKSTYKNYEIIVVENNSTEEEIFQYYEEIKAEGNIKVITWEKEFNYSAINNFGVKEADGEFLLLLNNDVEVISENWIEEMLMHAQRKDVGIVGAKLYFPDNIVQHAGIILGLGGVAGHSHKGAHRDEIGYIGRLKIVQNLSAVTAACLMVRKEIYDEVDGLDENIRVAFNDVDFCMKVSKMGYLVVFTPYSELYHYESKSRGDEDTPEKMKRFNSEIKRFYDKWGIWIKDPYYNENLTMIREDFSLKDDNIVNREMVDK